MKKIHRILLTVIAVTGVVFALFLSVYSLRYTVRRLLNLNGDVIDTKDSLIWNGFWIVLVFILVFFLGKVLRKCSDRAIHAFAVVVSLIVAAAGCYLAACLKSVPMVDQLQVYVTAEALFAGDTDWISDYFYYKMYPFQIGLAEMYYLIFRIAGKCSPMIIQYVQAVVTGGTVYFGYRITHRIFRSKVVDCVYLLCAGLFLPIYLFDLLIYGEAIGIFFALAAVWCFLEANYGEYSSKMRIMCHVLCYAALTFAYILRGSFLVLWIALVMIQILICIRTKRIWTILAPLLGIILMLGGQSAAINTAERIVGTEFGEGMPKILWVAMGLQENKENATGPGYYNCYTADVFTECNYNAAEASEIAREDIRKRFLEWEKEPGEMISFFKRKLLTQWNEPSYGVTCLIYSLDNPKEWAWNIVNDDMEHNWFLKMTNRFQSICNLALLGYFAVLVRRKEDERMYLPGLVWLGGLLFSLIWEAGSRYVYPYVVMILPCMAGSLVLYTDKLAELIRKASKRAKERLQNK